MAVLAAAGNPAISGRRRRRRRRYRGGGAGATGEVDRRELGSRFAPDRVSLHGYLNFSYIVPIFKVFNREEQKPFRGHSMHLQKEKIIYKHLAPPAPIPQASLGRSKMTHDD